MASVTPLRSAFTQPSWLLTSCLQGFVRSTFTKHQGHSDMPVHVYLLSVVLACRVSVRQQGKLCPLFSLGSLDCGRDVPQGLLVDAGELPAVQKALLLRMNCTAMQAAATESASLWAVGGLVMRRTCPFRRA